MGAYGTAKVKERVSLKQDIFDTSMRVLLEPPNSAAPLIVAMKFAGNAEAIPRLSRMLPTIPAYRINNFRSYHRGKQRNKVKKNKDK